MRLQSVVIMSFGLRKQHLTLDMTHLPLLRRAEQGHVRAGMVQQGLHSMAVTILRTLLHLWYDPSVVLQKVKTQHG